MTAFHLRCSECGTLYAERDVELVCPTCSSHQQPGGVIRGILEVELEDLPERWGEGPLSSTQDLAPFLPLGPRSRLPPLPVGGTPLLEPRRLRDKLALPRLYIKDDTRNPSGSTKDRASQLVVAKALEYGRDTVAAASTGNAATALAAVAAAAGLTAVVFVPAAAPEGKLVQMLCYGARVIPVEGSYDDAFELCLAACREYGWYNRNTAINPFTTEGKKTAALEIAAQMAPEEPDVVLVPTGDGSIISGLAKGFAELEACGLISRRPRMIAVQPEGSPAIARALAAGAETTTAVPAAASVADSLVVGQPRCGLYCLKQVRATGGAGLTVSEEAIVRSIAELARTTGVFAEPAGATALAGLEAALREGLVEPEERIVLLVTGNGLKDVPTASKSVRRPEPIEPTLEALATLG